MRENRCVHGDAAHTVGESGEEGEKGSKRRNRAITGKGAYEQSKPGAREEEETVFFELDPGPDSASVPSRDSTTELTLDTMTMTECQHDVGRVHTVCT